MNKQKTPPVAPKGTSTTKALCHHSSTSNYGKVRILEPHFEDYDLCPMYVISSTSK